MLPTVDNLVNDPLNASLPLSDDGDIVELLKPILKAAAERDAGACWIYVNRIFDEPVLKELTAWISRCGGNTFEKLQASRFRALAMRAWYDALRRIVATVERAVWPSERWPDPLPATTKWPLVRQTDLLVWRPLEELFVALPSRVSQSYDLYDRGTVLGVTVQSRLGYDGWRNRADLKLEFYPDVSKTTTPRWLLRSSTLTQSHLRGHIGVVGVDVVDKFAEALHLKGIDRQHDQSVFEAALDFVKVSQFPDDERFAATQIFVDWYCFRQHEIGYFSPPGRGIAMRTRS